MRRLVRLCLGRNPFTFERATLVAPLLVCLLAVPGNAVAQGDESHWAIHASAAPRWELAGFLQDLVEEGDEVNFKGSEFTIGIGRGRRRGGDWGISFVRKPFESGQVAVSRDNNCFSTGSQTACTESVERIFFNNVVLTGVEAHKFFPFATIKNRVQLGLNIAGGIATFDGEVTTVEEDQFPRFVPPNGVVIESQRSEETNPASEELLKVFPLVKVEAVGALILHESLKVKVAGGLNFPGTGVRVLATYLIGAR